MQFFIAVENKHAVYINNEEVNGQVETIQVGSGKITSQLY